MFRNNRFGWWGLIALICSAALFRVLQIVSGNVPVETAWVRVWATTVVALPDDPKPLHSDPRFQGLLDQIKKQRFNG